MVSMCNWADPGNRMRSVSGIYPFQETSMPIRSTALRAAAAVLVTGQIARAQILNTNIAPGETAGFFFDARI